MNRIGKTARRVLAGMAVAGLAGAGAAMILAGSAGSALASTPGACVASTIATDSNCTTTASVTVGSSTTIADNTPALVFNAPASLPGNATNNPLAVSLTVSTNDSAGYTVTATPSGDFTSGTTSAKIDASCLWVTGSSTQVEFGNTVCGTGGGDDPTMPVVTDTSAAIATNAALSDSYIMDVQNVPAATYSLTLTYSIAGN